MAMRNTMQKFWMDSKMPEDNRWHSKHQGPLITPDRLADHFVEQLRSVGRVERAKDVGGESELAIMVRFARIMKELMESYESQPNLLLKLADTGRVVALLHRSIDSALDTQDMHDLQQREFWHNELLKERQDRLKMFEDLVQDEEQLITELGDEEQQLEIVTLLRYCIDKYHEGIIPFAGEDEKFRDKLMPCELDTLSMVYDVVATKAGIVAANIPDWFVTSEHEWAWVNKDKLEDHKAPWSGKTTGMHHGEEVCVRTAAIWTQLNHPHLRKFYGASHVGKPFIVHETCYPPTYEKEMWRYLANCCLGLQYVHDRGLVYHNVLPVTFFCSYSERSGVMDGLGLTPQTKVDWSDKIAHQTRETLVSYDVLKFGIAIFFLLAGARNAHLPSNKRDKTFDMWDKKTTERLPRDRPGFIEEGEWEVLLGLCDEDPAKRIKLEAASIKMQALVSDASDIRISEETEVPDDIAEFFCGTYGGTIQELLDESMELFKRMETYSPLRTELRRACDRLTDMFNQLKDSDQRVPHKLAVDFSSSLLSVFHAAEDSQLGDSEVVAQFASKSIAGKGFHFHHEIDQLLRDWTQLEDCDGMHRWQPTWEQAQWKQKERVLKNLKSPSTFFEESDPEDIAMLRFEAQNRYGAYSPDTVEAMNSVLKEAEVRGIKNAEMIPKWFIPSYQIELGENIGEGGFALVREGKWFGTNVVVKRLRPVDAEEDRERFREEADLWFTLNHSNLIKLYGACYEGVQPFFVCERASRNTLDKYLRPENGRRRELWFRLLQAAMGLEHLHEHNIVHGDLKNDNILICEGGAAKIADFGLSILGNDPVNKKATQAVQWNAPECLMQNPSPPTFASDIYAFGMCIIQAVTGTFPWKYLGAEAVKHAVTVTKKLPERPNEFKDYEWELIERMCRWNPQERLGIGAVIKILEDIGIKNLMSSDLGANGKS